MHYLLNILKILAVVLLFLAALLVSQIWSGKAYMRKVSPEGIETYAQWEARFGEAIHPCHFRQGTNDYYRVFTSIPNGLARLYLVSGPPVYIFDAHSHLTAWHPDSGELPRSFREQWPAAGEPIDHATLTNALQKAPL